ncbi:MAG: bifunctional 4-alpha-glucanotransferase/malto-oligosyltrehalose synthase [Proteobacteria bacterium]|nr:bifunctional 4-alpha-glucanotransferase/malto-oligosyltrehalose synthase [Pseudomonadota bacterium]
MSHSIDDRPADLARAAPARRVAVVPRATYRLQFSRDFTFAQASAIVPYLAELGISHCYASPYLRARPGSSHGYDIVDHRVLNPEIGTTQSYDDFVVALKARDMGQIIDVVPNHMGIMCADNAWWLDVLENGPSSAWSGFFDIDWEPLNPELCGKVLLPLLGEHYGAALEGGKLRLDFDFSTGGFSLYYDQHRLPVDPATYPTIVGRHSEQLASTLGEDHPHYLELLTLLTAFSHLPAHTETTPSATAERRRDKEVHKRHLATLCQACPEIARQIADNLLEFNGVPGDSGSFDLLHGLIKRQSYRLAYWRVASDEINYRRFFDINDLAALRMEDLAVFEATHRFVLDLLAKNPLDGLRIDHPDGLYNPGEYLVRLQQAVAGGTWSLGDELPLYIVVEKILADHERLPDDWPVHGATGYRFANQTNGLFVDSSAERLMTRIYQGFTGERTDFDTLAYDAKKLIMHSTLAGELNVLAARLARIAAASRHTCDFTLNGLRDALVEMVACFPVYRSYVAGGQLSADDRRHITWARAVAKKRNPTADPGIHDFVASVLTTDIAAGRLESYRLMVESFAMKFQQFSSPVMAKGVEDTAFYRYHRLTSLNDVGGDPRHFGISVAAYHAAARTRAARRPHNLLASSTHDSKRSEDVRARLNVLSEIPARWKLMLKRWSRLNRGRKVLVDGVKAPSSNDEYLLYQTLVGAWPLDPPDAAARAQFAARIEAYMIKALREAKQYTSWANVNADYEAALSGFIHGLLSAGENNLFLADFIAAVEPVAHFGLLNSLAQTLIKLTAPGVPDIYQGCELWQFNLVDPDNRRPVDFALRRELLAQVKVLVDAPPTKWRQNLQPLVADLADGRIKLYLVWQGLALRQRWPEVFRAGDYLPLTACGTQAAHVFAFARHAGKRIVITVVPRLSARLLGTTGLLPVGLEVWGDTALELPPEWAPVTWFNVLSGERHSPSGMLPVGQLLSGFPVALLAAFD